MLVPIVPLPQYVTVNLLTKSRYSHICNNKVTNSNNDSKGNNSHTSNLVIVIVINLVVVIVIGIKAWKVSKPA